MEAAGDTATGARIGRAVEPSAGENADDGARRLCLNCGTALLGPHCHACGQSAHVHRSVGAIGHDLLHGVFHFEGKLWRTLPLLAWHPGILTRRYIAGERSRFVTPMALFLFSIFTMFVLFIILGISTPTNLDTAPEVRAGIEHTIEQAEDARKDAVEKRAALAPDDPERAKLDARISELNHDIETLGSIPSHIGPIGAGNWHSSWHALDHGIRKWQTNPGLMLYKLQSSGYKFSWLLIPISLPFMWLLFAWKPGVHMYDHAVFVTYSIAFMSFVFIALTIAGALGVGWNILGIVAVAVPVWHIHRQLKEAYRLGRFSAAWRTVALLFCMIGIALIFLTALLMLGMFG